MINPLATSPQIQAEQYLEGTNLSIGEGNETGDGSLDLQHHDSKTVHHVTQSLVQSKLCTKSAVADDEFIPLSGKPYFHCIMSKTHLKPKYQLVLPVKMYSILPSSVVPVVLTRQNRNWEMQYFGNKYKHKSFDISWRSFAVDNNLKIGDGCFFEIMELSSEIVKFRVQILSGEIPSEFLSDVDGESSNKPILIE